MLAKLQQYSQNATRSEVDIKLLEIKIDSLFREVVFWKTEYENSLRIRPVLRSLLRAIDHAILVRIEKLKKTKSAHLAFTQKGLDGIEQIHSESELIKRIRGSDFEAYYEKNFIVQFRENYSYRIVKWLYHVIRKTSKTTLKILRKIYWILRGKA